MDYKRNLIWILLLALQGGIGIIHYNCSIDEMLV